MILSPRELFHDHVIKRCTQVRNWFPLSKFQEKCEPVRNTRFSQTASIFKPIIFSRHSFRSIFEWPDKNRIASVERASDFTGKLWNENIQKTQHCTRPNSPVRHKRLQQSPAASTTFAEQQKKEKLEICGETIVEIAPQKARTRRRAFSSRWRTRTISRDAWEVMHTGRGSDGNRKNNHNRKSRGNKIIPRLPTVSRRKMQLPA